MSERAAQRRSAWEALIGLVGVLVATQVAGGSMLKTIAASAFTSGVAAFARAGAMILKAAASHDPAAAAGRQRARWLTLPTWRPCRPSRSGLRPGRAACRILPSEPVGTVHW
jgi:hypothetical protein